MCVKIKIKEPWWGAHRKFGWAPGTWGVGLKKRDVDVAAVADGELDVHVWKFRTSYKLSARVVQDYAKEHNTLYTARAGVQLYVVPSTLMEGKL